MVYSYSGYYLVLEKEENPAICHHTGEAGGHYIREISQS